jgi:hypothetical protein
MVKKNDDKKGFKSMDKDKKSKQLKGGNGKNGKNGTKPIKKK